MTEQLTVSEEKKEREGHAHDLAPLSPSQQLTSVSDDLSIAAPSENLIHLESRKRLKTAGERMFDIGTYAGVALIGNEVASFGITEVVKKNPTVNGKYKQFESLFSGLKRSADNIGAPRLSEYVTGNASLKMAPRLPYLLVATLGGMLMVPFVKHLEDRKGSIVRKLDRDHYGDASDTDPTLVAAHKEMDEAPHQSWGSLWKGRFTTVLSAAAADFSFGWSDAPSTKLFAGTALNNYSSLDRFSTTVARRTVAGITKDASLKTKLTDILAKPEFIHLDAAEGKAVSRVANASWLLTLSTTLTVLFYASSKLFARKSEEKQEQKLERASDIAHGLPVRDASLSLAAEATLDKPQSRVSEVTYEKSLAQPRQPALSV